MAINTLSNRSSIPPWPGRILPESLTPNVRFSNDSVKSPHVANNTTAADSPNQCHLPISGAMYAKTCELNKAITTPPQNPSHDFLGEMRSKSLCLPIIDPTKNAPVSFSHTKTKSANIGMAL